MRLLIRSHFTNPAPSPRSRQGVAIGHHVAVQPPLESGPAEPRSARSGLGKRLRRLLRSPVVLHNILYLVGIGGSGAGVLVAQSYGAHHLSTVGNGESTSVVAVLNLLYTTTFVVAAGAAREVASEHARGAAPATLWPGLRGSALKIGLWLGAAMVPVDLGLAFLLHLPDPYVLAVTVVAGPISAMGGAQRGFLQGGRDFGRLAVNFLLYGGTMVVLSVILLRLGLGPAAVPLASVAGALGSAAYPRHPHVQHPAASGRHLLDGTVVAGAATAPLFNNLDVVSARHVLTPYGAGLYSGLSVMGKILFFGTSSLSAVMYPRVAAAPDGATRRRLLLQTGAVLVAVDLVVVLGYAILARPLLGVVLGPAYEQDTPLLVLFSLGVVGLTVVNLLVYYGMGSRDRLFALVPAIGVPALLGWLFTSSPQVTSFVPRIASALLILAALEAALILPRALSGR